MDTLEVGVRVAGRADARDVRDVLCAAFFSDPVFEWVTPEPVEQRTMLAALFEIVVTDVLRRGVIHVVGDGAGVALWLTPDSPALGEQEAHEFMDGVEHACAGLPRAAELVRFLDAHHPRDVPHYYLGFCAVRTDVQGRGLGSVLLDHMLRDCDAASVPAYLEASNVRNLRLYLQFGFVPLGAPLGLPDGPDIYPAWREPR